MQIDHGVGQTAVAYRKKKRFSDEEGGATIYCSGKLLDGIDGQRLYFCRKANK
jgi:hypothetical protein